MTNREILIIGAGVAGCSIAYHLARLGVPSRIIDRESIGARASGKAWALFSYPPPVISFESNPPDAQFSMPKGSTRHIIELFWNGYHRLPDIALDLKERGGIDIGFGELPGINTAYSENEEKEIRKGMAEQESYGFYEGRWIDAKEIIELFPDIKPGVVGGGITPAFQIEPYRYTLGLGQVAENLGANITQGDVVGFRHQGTKVTAVKLASGTEVQADIFVLAMGPWIGQGTAMLGKELPVVVSREQCVRVQLPKKLPPYSLGALTGGVSIIPKVDGSIVLGHAGVLDSPESLDAPLITEKFKEEVLEATIEMLPSLCEAKVIEQRGDFECWPTAPFKVQPTLGRLPEWDNVYIAARLGTSGMMCSLGVGQLMADLIISGGKPSERVRHLMDVLSPANLKY